MSSLPACASPDRETVGKELIVEWNGIRDQLNCLAVLAHPSLGELGTLLVPDFLESCVHGAKLLGPKLNHLSGFRQLVMSPGAEIASPLLMEMDSFSSGLRNACKDRAKAISAAMSQQMLDDLILWFDLEGYRSVRPLQVAVPDLQDLLRTGIVRDFSKDPQSMFHELELFFSHSAAGWKLTFPLIRSLSMRTVREEVTHYLSWNEGFRREGQDSGSMTNEQVTEFAWYESVGVAVQILHGPEDPWRYHLPKRPLFGVVREIWQKAQHKGWSAALEDQFHVIRASGMSVQVIGHEFGFVIGPILAQTIAANPRSRESRELLFPVTEPDPFQRLIEAQGRAGSMLQM